MTNASRDICLYENTDKTEFMSFTQDKTIYTIKGKPLIFVDKFR